MEKKTSGRILVIDDSVEIQRVVKKGAEAAGYEVVQAFDGPPGLALASAEKFDLILLDITMPEMDGRDVLSRLKQSASADVPVLVYSGRSTQHDRRLTYELGAADHVDKPFDIRLLVIKIGQVIEKARSERTSTPPRD